MKQVSIHEAKTHLSRLVDLALAGEEVIIARRKKPLIRLAVLKEDPTRRKVGTLNGMVQAMGDDFNDSMDDWAEDVTPMPPPKRKSRKRSAST